MNGLSYFMNWNHAVRHTMSKEYRIGDIEKLFKAQVVRNTILAAEKNGDIPLAIRKPDHHIKSRFWSTEQLPFIGKKFGFLSTPKKQHLIVVHVAKGANLKSSLTFNLARMLAINGIKTLVVGLDSQASVTNALIRDEPQSIAEIKPRKGLYHLFYENTKEIIIPTDLPTLSLIPESIELYRLDRQLRFESFKEHLFAKHLIPILSDYKVIIFDTAPSWSALIENALTIATSIICPLSCDIETYIAIQTNREVIFDYLSKLNKDIPLWHVPVLLEKTNLSQQIYGSYLTSYQDQVLPFPIRKSVNAQEARLKKLSIIEHDPSSLLANDYYDLVMDMWGKLNG